MRAEARLYPRARLYQAQGFIMIEVSGGCYQLSDDLVF